ncbi:hypothetical protein [Opitutus terrae]|uniref:Uncharacterized protein n=1 Tax=Opitutus terrae (strain DSM 11246 / JCM 15787 / PB90-1) TaxID=452637 RepID=B1ZWD7_OPITP|nr:hypothetical protein [Opitutus terrae]ACB76889.1 hypothetical protein Oter_3612 [Opitutus terrae PB90-1]
MRRLRASSTAEMIATFLQQEVASTRFGPAVRALLAKARLPEDLVTRPDLHDRRANTQRRGLLGAHRGYGSVTNTYLASFPTAGVRWAWWTLLPAELLAVRYINWDYWLELSGGTRRPLDAAAHVRAGVEPYGVNNAGVWAVAATVRAGGAIPPLILVTSNRYVPGRGLGDLVVLEGHMRLTGYALASDALPPALDVLIGASPAIARWTCY